MTVRPVLSQSTVPAKPCLPSSPHTYESPLRSARAPLPPVVLGALHATAFPRLTQALPCREERHNLLQQSMSGGVENLIPACLPSSLWLAATQSITDMEERETAPDRWAVRCQGRCAQCVFGRVAPSGWRHRATEESESAPDDELMGEDKATGMWWSWYCLHTAASCLDF